MKKGTLFISCFLTIITLLSCGNGQGNSNQWNDPEIIQMSDTDRSVQFYVAFNVHKFANGEPFTTDDLQASGRLLLTPGGNVKAIEFSDGYHRVYSFRCEPLGGGWYKITCWLKSGLTGEEYTHTCYTREKI